MADVLSLLKKALERRGALLGDPQTTAYRLFHGPGEGEPGLVVERLGEVLVVQLHEGRLVADQAGLRGPMEWLMAEVGATAAYVKHFVRDRAAGEEAVGGLHRDPVPWIGEAVPETVTVRENGLAFVVRPYDGYSVGLFLEQRANRRRVREVARGKRVLNTFAYTCGFSVAAAVGGVGQVVSVDISKRYLEWGKENFAANGLALGDHLFFASDTQEYLARAGRQGRQFEVVVLDPPTFGRVKKTGKVFVLEQELGGLLRGAVKVLTPGGMMLVSTNNRQMGVRRLEGAVRAAAGGRKVEIVERPRLGVDFPGDPAFASFLWVRVG